MIQNTTFNYRIASLPENINQLNSILDQIQLLQVIDSECLVNIELVLGEALNNAIIHGNLGDGEKNVSVDLTMENNYLTFIVSDEGKGFNYNSLPDPTLPENLEKTTGRGVFLMKNLCEWVVFSNNGSCVELKFKI